MIDGAVGRMCVSLDRVSVSRETLDDGGVVSVGSLDDGGVGCTCFLILTVTVIVEPFTIFSYLFLAGVCSRIVSYGFDDTSFSTIFNVI